MGRTSDARERLIESGRDLMQQRGYTAVGVAELCEEAGVNKGSFYHQFPSKRELALEVIDSFWSESSTLLDGVATGDGPPLERIRGFFEKVHARHVELRDQCGRVHGCPLGNLAQEMSTQDPVLRERLGQIFDLHVDRLERVIAEAAGRGDLPAQDTRRAARSLTALLQGAILLAKTKDDPETLASLGDDALRLLGAPGSGA
jgi:TetR/AcrR family transcriptional repressor of nem operon